MAGAGSKRVQSVGLRDGVVVNFRAGARVESASIVVYAASGMPRFWYCCFQRPLTHSLVSSVGEAGTNLGKKKGGGEQL